MLARCIFTAGRRLAGCHLWALDTPAEEVREWTRGSGPGLKFDLLNALISTAPPPRGTHVIITDDDYRFVDGGFSRFVRIAEVATLDMAQPAHMPRSHHSHPITVARPLTLARLSGTVEVGPVFVINQSAVETVVPFPAQAGMGWGLESVWAAQGLLCGLVDAVPIVHLSPVADTYDKNSARAYRDRMLSERGLTAETSPWVDGPRWRVPRPSPPWATRR